MIKRVHVCIEGRVQGVFFRACTQEEAQRLGLTGWVRNRPDGSVESVIEGDPEKVSTMVHWLHHGPPYATVTRIVVTEEEPDNSYGDFSIQY